MKQIRIILSIFIAIMIVFYIIPTWVITAGYGTNSSTLDPTSWVGSDDGTNHVKELTDYGDFSITLRNDGKFQVNAPSLTGNFEYWYMEASNKNNGADIKTTLIWSSKSKASTRHNNHLFSTTGEGFGDFKLPTSGVIDSLSDKYL